MAPATPVLGSVDYAIEPTRTLQGKSLVPAKLFLARCGEGLRREVGLGSVTLRVSAPARSQRRP